MTRLTWLLLALLLLVACAPAGGLSDAPSATASRPADLAATPQSNAFFGLPTFYVGETAEFDGFRVTLTDVALDGTELSLTLDLVNETERAVDLAWAVQLHHSTGYVPPLEPATGEAAALSPASAVSTIWRYDLSETSAADATTADAAGVLADYLLLYAPRGWSGPVIVYRLDAPR